MHDNSVMPGQSDHLRIMERLQYVVTVLSQIGWQQDFFLDLVLMIMMIIRENF